MVEVRLELGPGIPTLTPLPSQQPWDLCLSPPPSPPQPRAAPPEPLWTCPLLVLRGGQFWELDAGPSCPPQI